MSSTVPSSTRQALVDELEGKIAELETQVQQKIAKGNTLRTAFATKYDGAVVTNIRKKLDLSGLS